MEAVHGSGPNVHACLWLWTLGHLVEQLFRVLKKKRACGCGPFEGLLHTPSAGTQKKKSHISSKHPVQPVQGAEQEYTLSSAEQEYMFSSANNSAISSSTAS